MHDPTLFTPRPVSRSPRRRHRRRLGWRRGGSRRTQLLPDRQLADVGHDPQETRRRRPVARRLRQEPALPLRKSRGSLRGEFHALARCAGGRAIRRRLGAAALRQPPGEGRRRHLRVGGHAAGGGLRDSHRLGPIQVPRARVREPPAGRADDARSRLHRGAADAPAGPAPAAGNSARPAPRISWRTSPATSRPARRPFSGSRISTATRSTWTG